MKGTIMKTFQKNYYKEVHIMYKFEEMLIAAKKEGIKFNKKDVDFLRNKKEHTLKPLELTTEAETKEQAKIIVDDYYKGKISEENRDEMHLSLLYERCIEESLEALDEEYCEYVSRAIKDYKNAEKLCDMIFNSNDSDLALEDSGLDSEDDFDLNVEEDTKEYESTEGTKETESNKEKETCAAYKFEEMLIKARKEGVLFLNGEIDFLINKKRKILEPIEDVKKSSEKVWRRALLDGYNEGKSRKEILKEMYWPSTFARCAEESLEALDKKYCKYVSKAIEKHRKAEKLLDIILSSQLPLPKC